MWNIRSRFNIVLTVTLNNSVGPCLSNNILKIWKALHMHFEKHPKDRNRYPIFTTGFQRDFPFLARGSTGPLGGERMFAEYFHGRYVADFYIYSSD